MADADDAGSIPPRPASGRPLSPEICSSPLIPKGINKTSACPYRGDSFLLIPPSVSYRLLSLSSPLPAFMTVVRRKLKCGPAAKWKVNPAFSIGKSRCPRLKLFNPRRQYLCPLTFRLPSPSPTLFRPSERAEERRGFREIYKDVLYTRDLIAGVVDEVRFLMYVGAQCR